MTEFWKDPLWKLVMWERSYFGTAPGDRPPDPKKLKEGALELMGGGAWCALFVAHRKVAEWARDVPMTKAERAALSRRGRRSDLRPPG